MNLSNLPPGVTDSMIEGHACDPALEEFMDWLSQSALFPADFVEAIDFKVAWLEGRIGVLDRQIGEADEPERIGYRSRLQEERQELSDMLNVLREES